MAEEEAPEQAQKKETGAPAISGKGWIIVIGICVLQWVFFAIWIMLGSTDPKTNAETEKAAQKIDASTVNKYKVNYSDLVYSKSGTGANKTNVLMSLELILGPTQEELDSATGEMPTDLDMAEFQAAVTSLEPDIKDRLQTIIDNMTTQQLDKPEGKASIKRLLADYVNERLANMNFAKVDKKFSRKRVTLVTISKFIIQ